jgi:hypothetical protein
VNPMKHIWQIGCIANDEVFYYDHIILGRRRRPVRWWTRVLDDGGGLSGKFEILDYTFNRVKVQLKLRPVPVEISDQASKADCNTNLHVQ